MTRDEQTVRELFAALDTGNTQGALELMTEDVLFRFGSAPPRPQRLPAAGRVVSVADRPAAQRRR
jgi:ketosteroid isomerase-like protein